MNKSRGTNSITLNKLAFAHYIFSAFDSGAYPAFPQNINGFCPDLTKKANIDVLIEWLKDWGCRSITKNNNSRTAISSWYSRNKNKLPNTNRNLGELNNKEIASIDEAYQAIEKIKFFGPTTAAKILHAIRPKALMAWDTKIQEHYVGKNGSYQDFFGEMRLLAECIEKQLNKHNLKLMQLPPAKSYLTVPKLIDEYNWITITKGLRPTRDDFKQWLGRSN